jgi:hypothetical protein
MSESDRPVDLGRQDYLAADKRKSRRLCRRPPDAPLFAAFVWVLDQNSYHVTGGACEKLGDGRGLRGVRSVSFPASCLLGKSVG